MFEGSGVKVEGFRVLVFGFRVRELKCRVRACLRVEGLGLHPPVLEASSGDQAASAIGCSGLRIQGSGFRVQGSGFRVQGPGFRVQGSGFRVQGPGSRVQGPGKSTTWGKPLPNKTPSNAPKWTRNIARCKVKSGFATSLSCTT